MIIRKTQSSSEFMIGIADDGLIDKIGIKIILLRFISSITKVRILPMIKSG
jgi:hypothetical protein